MTDLVEFLNAQYKRIEAAALDATEGPWSIGSVMHDIGTADVLSNSGNVTSAREEPCCSIEDATHIAIHDPVFVLAEIQSKRKTLELHYVVGFDDDDGHDIGRGCAECGYSAEYSDRGGWCETVRLLAAPFSGEPGYREDWTR